MQQIGCSARCAVHNFIMDPKDTWCPKCEPDVVRARRMRTIVPMPTNGELSDEQCDDFHYALEIQAARSRSERN